MSTTAVPPGVCLVHGSYSGSACPNCSTAVLLARDQTLYGFSVVEDGRRVDPSKIKPEW
jgi:hypothetical protein